MAAWRRAAQNMATANLKRILAPAVRCLERLAGLLPSVAAENIAHRRWWKTACARRGGGMALTRTLFFHWLAGDRQATSMASISKMKEESKGGNNQ